MKSLSDDEVYALREELGWVSPVKPLQRDELWCVFSQRGTWEWMVHPEDAVFYLENGILVNEKHYAVKVVGEWPLINAIQLMARDDSVNLTFIEGANTDDEQL